MDLTLDQKAEDILLIDGDLVIVKNRSDECAQRLYLRFKTFKREWFFNLDYGIDYLKDVFGVAVSKTTVDILFRNEVLKEYLVKDIVSFSSEITDYKYKCSFIVETIDENQTVQMYFLATENSLILTDASNNKLYTIL